MRIWPIGLPLLSGCCPPPTVTTVDASAYVPLDGFAADLGAQCAQLCEDYARYFVTRVDACDLELVDAGVGQVRCVVDVQSRCIGGRRPHEWVRADPRSSRRQVYTERMKRLLLVASLPLPLAGCHGGICSGTPPPPRTTYVDSSNFDDGGYMEQACAAAGCSLEGSYYCRSAEPFDMGVAEVDCGPYGCTGRRPQELVRARVDDGESVGRWLAEAAQLEAASVPAFEILARELGAHDAPPSLIQRALTSADDERRHARMMTSMARAHGVTPGPVRVVVREPRALEAVAHENAVEGLVREAYGARVAIDPAIATDEERHADLARDVHAWIRPRLSYAARLRVDEARAAARAQLIAQCAVELPRAVRDELGLPDATRAVELARAT